jgi:hydrogenase maturation protein HypF
VGSVVEGFERIAHLRPAALPGGDAAAQFPVQAAAGFLAQLEHLPDLHQPPFIFPDRFRGSMELVRKNVRTFPTTSVGRLFDTAAALLGFTRPISYEGQAAIWLEQLARTAGNLDFYELPTQEDALDWRPTLVRLLHDRQHGRPVAEIARAFQRGIALSIIRTVNIIAADRSIDTVVLSGGVFQNELLLEDIHSLAGLDWLRVWTNRTVPANDGGISLGQAALASFSLRDN